jgi:hypothetical protein
LCRKHGSASRGPCRHGRSREPRWRGWVASSRGSETAAQPARPSSVPLSVSRSRKPSPTVIPGLDRPFWLLAQERRRPRFPGPSKGLFRSTLWERDSVRITRRVGRSDVQEHRAVELLEHREVEPDPGRARGAPRRSPGAPTRPRSPTPALRSGGRLSRPPRVVHHMVGESTSTVRVRSTEEQTRSAAVSRSELDNLRPACARCNLAKGAG